MMVIFSASRLLSSLNTEVAPCENFYEFACGTWAKKNVIPEDVSSYTMFSVVREDVEVIMKSRSRRIKKKRPDKTHLECVEMSVFFFIVYKTKTLLQGEECFILYFKKYIYIWHGRHNLPFWCYFEVKD